MTPTQELQRQQHEVFVNAPLQLVAVEVTFPATDADVDTELFAALREVVGAGRTVLGGRFRLTGQPEPDGSAPGETMLFRVTNDSKTTSVSAWPTSLIVECSEYERYEQFRDLVTGVVDAYARFMAPAAVTRFGMRYIDEVHVPDPITSVSSWAPYVNPALIAAAGVVGERVSNLSSGFTLDLGEHRSINVRYGTSPKRALMSEGHLVLRERPDTPAFVLDIDAIFEPPQPQPTPVVGGLIAALADQLRPGARKVFDAVFTPAALETFRHEEPKA